MKIATVLAGLLLVAAFAVAAEVDGVWEGIITVTGTDVPVRWTFKANGSELTGSVSQAGGPEIAIKNGKIDGNKITFLLSLEFQGNMLDINYSGVVSGDEMKLTGEVMGQTFEYTVKKVKPSVL